MNLRERREALGYGQAELARMVNMSPCSLCRLESGARPSYETAAKLAEALGCNVSDLWPGERLLGYITVPKRGSEVPA